MVFFIQCATPLQSKKTVSKTFRFDRNWRAFFWTFPMICHQLWPFWATSIERCFCSIFSNSGTIFAAARFMPKTSVKITWHEPNDMPRLSATSLIEIQRLSKIIFFTFIVYWRAPATRTSIVIDIFSAFLKPVIPQLNFVLFIVGSSKVTVNISYVFAHLNPFFIQNLVQFIWFIF